MLRDALMAQNVSRLADGGAKTIVWAHNAHVSKAPVMYQDMGRRLARRFGKRYLAIGTAFGQGTVRALGRDRTAGPGVHEVPPPVKGSFDHALGAAGLARFAIDLRTAPPEVARWLSGPVPSWSIGFAYAGPEGARLPIAPRRSFDVVVYVADVSATEPL